MNILISFVYKQMKNHNHGGIVAELYYTNKLLITLFVPWQFYMKSYYISQNSILNFGRIVIHPERSIILG